MRHTGVCFQRKREGCVVANSCDLIAILQHDLCEEIGQLARLPFSQARPTGSSPYLSCLCKQQPGINVRQPTQSAPRTTAPQNQMRSYWLGVTRSAIPCLSLESKTSIMSLKDISLMFAFFSLGLGGAKWSCEGHRGWNGCNFFV